MSEPTERQREQVRAVVEWYLAVHHGDGSAPGLPAMYADREQVGALAIDLEALQQGEASALFGALVTTAMFQRLRDVLVKSILRRIPEELAETLTDEHRLRELADQSSCPALLSTTSLRADCDLRKDPETGRGSCSRAMPGGCHLHVHTEALRRYGHFGKVPTSIALAVREAGAADTAHLHALALGQGSPSAAARWLEGTLSRAWRVSDKIAAMYCSLVSNPDIMPGAPWQEGVDWRYFVVVDVNVDRYLAATGYGGAGTYAARRRHVVELARGLDLSELRPGLEPDNPRLVQQALYLFMSASNRAAAPEDCSHEPARCASCPRLVRELCPSRPDSA